MNLFAGRADDVVVIIDVRVVVFTVFVNDKFLHLSQIP